LRVGIRMVFGVGKGAKVQKRGFISDERVYAGAWCKILAFRQLAATIESCGM